MEKVISLFLIGLFFFLHEATYASILCANKTNEVCSPQTVSCTDVRTTLKVGSRGTEVSTMQNYLYTNSYLTTSPTGYFGYQTQSAVKEFQKVHGIDQTGIVGPITRLQIKNNSCGTTTTTTICPTLAKLCPDGITTMPKGQNCEWYPEKCPSTTINNPLQSAGGAWSTWNTSMASTSGTLLDSLKKLFSSYGFPINFATTTMSENDILQMTRKFEIDYIGK